MVENTSVRQLAVAAAAVFFQCRRALALPQAGEVAPPAPSPWVAVDNTGNGVTITPGVFTTNGATTTVSQPPGSLLSTGTYTLSPSGHASTYTGLPPVATPSGTQGAGAFLACTVYQDAIAPFCLPRQGALLYTGQNYYLTWNPANFADPEQAVIVQATLDDGEGEAGGNSVSVSTGYYVWNIPSDFLTKLGRSSTNLTFSLVEDTTATGQNITQSQTIQGPTVLVLGGPPPNTSGGTGGHTNAVAIAVPVVVAVVVLLLGGLCFWSWRRHGSVPLVGSLGKSRRSSGYGVRQSRSERVGGGGIGMGVGNSDKPGSHAGIQLTDRDSWSPTGTVNTKNVFREELQRQDRQR